MTEKYYFQITTREIPADHKTNVYFYYHHVDASSKLRVSDKFEPEIDIYYVTGAGKKVSNLALSNFYFSSSFIFLQVYTNMTYEAEGRYYIVLRHKNAQKQNLYLKYQIMVNREEIVYVIPDSGYIDTLPVGSFDAYEMYVSEPSQIYLELFNCIGKQEINAARTYADLVSGENPNTGV